MAQIELGTLEELIGFSNGDYGRGTAAEPLDVVLTADLDFSLYEEENYSWPGCSGTWYITFNGQNHTIDNIYADSSSPWGFFEELHGTLENLKLTHVYAIGTGQTALFAIRSYDSKINNCHGTGQVQATDGNCSGITAYAENCTISRCSFSGILMSLGTGNYAAPLICVGVSNKPSYVSNCTILANITATNYACTFGGFARFINCIYQGFLKASISYMPIVHSGTMINCIVIIQSGTSGTLLEDSGNAYNCYYDSDTAESAGITTDISATDLMPATTAKLKNVPWMNNNGLPCVSG